MAVASAWLGLVLRLVLKTVVATDLRLHTFWHKRCGSVAPSAKELVFFLRCDSSAGALLREEDTIISLFGGARPQVKTVVLF